MPEPAGSTPEQPLYMKIVLNDNGQISWTRIAVMLGLTVLSGYLASKSQRLGASAVEIPIRARYYHGLQTIAGQQAKFWTEVQKRAAFRYDVARL